MAEKIPGKITIISADVYGCGDIRGERSHRYVRLMQWFIANQDMPDR
jgi:hypothetical protein